MRDIDDDIHRIETVLATNIFEPQNSNQPLLTAAITEVIICLNDFLQKLKDFGFPVTFTDDVPIIDDIEDITDLTNKIRNALVHISSKTHFLNEHVKTGRNVIYYQKTTNNIVLGGTPLVCDYDDDVCFFFGKIKIYLHRHILRALAEAKANLALFKKTIPPI